MLVCKKCNYESLLAFECCPKCKEVIKLDAKERQEYIEKQKTAKQKKEYEAYVEYSKILAWSGYTDCERELGIMLEKGDLVARNYDEAMRFFHRAAKKHDAFSAYRYSRLVSRTSDKIGNFWLLYSALLGCPDAYPAAAQLLSKECREGDANHFYILSAKHDDVDSIVEVAMRYYKGIGLPQSSEYAKYYMEKLSFPPLYAIKLAYRLKGVRSAEPPAERFDKELFIKRLLKEASDLNIKEAYFKLTSLLAECEDVDSMTVLGTLLADGIGCERDTEEAIRVFTEAAALGSKDAYICLAKIFLSDEYKGMSPELAVRYLEQAVKLDSSEAAFMLGEIYENGEHISKDYKKAEAYFRKAANNGMDEAELRADAIIALRNKIYKEATENKENPEKSFKGLAIAAAMGHAGAPIKLADAYLKGAGVKRDRGAAFYWYAEAVALGDDSAVYPLGLCYAMGVGINRDFEMAKKTLTKAARLGSEGARIALKKLYEGKRRKLSRKLYSKAMRLIFSKKYEAARISLEGSFELGYAKAGYILGCMYEFGLGMSTDREIAGSYYLKAYNGGFSDLNSKYKKLVLKLIR